jgi:uncharacterized repeat protein (TIGR04076 family)
MTNYNIKLEITEILGEGKCPREHQIGDVFSYPEDVGKLCPSALNSIYPTICVLQSGGSYPWFQDPDSHTRCCPDPKRPVVLKITRTEIQD